MVGKLVRRRIYFYLIKSSKPERWGWDDEQNADGNDPKSERFRSIRPRECPVEKPTLFDWKEKSGAGN